MPYEKIWDLSFIAHDKEQRAPHIVGNLLWLFLGTIFKICFRYKAINRERLRGFEGKSGVLVVSNHASYLDPVFIYLAGRPKQWVRFMGRDDLFPKGKRIAGLLLTRVGAFPVKRNSADRGAIKRASRMLKEGEAVGIFPEGTRRGKGNLDPEIHSGAAFIAKMGRAPLLPATIHNVERIKEKGKRLHFPKISVEFGQPILLEDFDFLPKEQRLDACSWYVMRECFALNQGLPREEVDMRLLFPNSPDFSDVFANHILPEHTTEEVVCAYAAEKVEVSEVTSEGTSAMNGTVKAHRQVTSEGTSEVQNNSFNG